MNSQFHVGHTYKGYPFEYLQHHQYMWHHDTFLRIHNSDRFESTNKCRHWVDKNVLPWSKDYIETKLYTIHHNNTIGNDELILAVDKVGPITGDADLSQRKGKAIVIFDMKIEFSVKGVSTGKQQQEAEPKDGEDKSAEEENVVFSSDISLPEFIHDMDLEDYQFEIKNRSALTAEQKKIVEKEFLPLVARVLMEYQKDVIAEHGKDLQHAS